MKKLIRIEEIKLTLDNEENLLQSKIIKILGIKFEDILSFKIVKKAIDSRNKKEIFFVYSVDVIIKNQENYFEKLSILIQNNIKKHKVREIEDFVYEIKKVNKKPKNAPIVI
jgi:uncharacterized FAD-dependent dehydrogenase